MSEPRTSGSGIYAVFNAESGNLIDAFATETEATAFARELGDGTVVVKSGPKTNEILSQRSAIPHGTHGGYTNHRCRCDECRAANAAWAVSYRARNPEQAEKHRQRERQRRAKNRTARA